VWMSHLYELYSYSYYECMQRITISLPDHTADLLKELVASRQVSAYIARAVHDKLMADKLSLSDAVELDPIAAFFAAGIADEGKDTKKGIKKGRV
jgi:hypothetical protein